MPPVTPTRILATRTLCPLLGAFQLPIVVLDLSLGDLLQGHGEVVLRARLDQRRGRFLEAHPLAELMVVAVDLACALRGDDDQRVARVDVAEQVVDTWLDHGPGMVAAL